MEWGTYGEGYENKASKGYQVDDDEQALLSSLPGVSVYSLEGALSEAINPVFEYFLEQTHCTKCAALALEREVIEALPKVIEVYAVAVPRFCEDRKS